MPGWGAYVSENKYQNHIAACIDKDEVSKLIYLWIAMWNNSMLVLTDQYMWLQHNALVHWKDWYWFNKLKSQVFINQGL